MRLTFVGGIHGVGKTSLCRELAPLLGARHVTAGTVIREVTGRRDNSTEKPVATPDADQEVLLEGLGHLRVHAHLLVDGHFCLLAPGGGVTKIAVEVFRRMGLDDIVLVTADPAQIAERLEARDARAYQAGELDALQRAEVAQAESVARALGVPLLHVEPRCDARRLAAALLATVGRY